MTKCIFNDDWQTLEEVSIGIQSEAIQYGYGLFETMRTYQDRSLPFVAEHLQRLSNSLEKLELDCTYSSRQIEAMIQRLVSDSEHELQRIKVLVIPEGVLVTSHKLCVPANGDMRLTTTRVSRSLAEHKTTSYMDCQLAWRSAQKQGFDDSILIDANDMVSETGRGNLFWVNNGQIYTRSSDVLPGIMRDCVMSLATVAFADVSIDELLAADELFVTNSIRGIAPVSAVDDTPFVTHDVTTNLKRKLADHIAIRLQDNSQ